MALGHDGSHMHRGKLMRFIKKDLCVPFIVVQCSQRFICIYNHRQSMNRMNQESKDGAEHLGCFLTLVRFDSK